MRNHFHLAVETPRGNLVAGMQWLQATFAIRFNRFRREQGHLFQGRYKSILIEPGPAIAHVVNYIHLNPVRAGVVPIADLGRYQWSSYVQFRRKQPPDFFKYEDWLYELGGLKSTRAGWRSYEEYLAWLAEHEVEKKRQAFERMSKGWALGSKDWRKAVIEDHEATITKSNCQGKDYAEVKEAEWTRTLEGLLQAAGKTKQAISSERKGVAWKVEIAAELRRTTSAPNRWIARKLQMGRGNSVSQLLHWRKAAQR